MEDLTLDDDFILMETERLLLRSPEPSDAEFLFQHFSDPDVHRHLFGDERIASREQAQTVIDFYLLPENRLCCRWVLVRKSDSKAIGTCGFHKWNPAARSAEIGYDLERALWGQGYMTEALAPVLSCGFTQLGLERIEAVVSRDNPRSARVLTKLGFKPDAFFWQVLRLRRKFRCQLLLSLSLSKWTKRKVAR